MSAADVLLADRKYVSSVSRSLTISGGGGSTSTGEGRASGAEKDRTFRFFAPAGGGGGLGGAAAPNRNETSRVATPSRTVSASATPRSTSPALSHIRVVVPPAVPQRPLDAHERLHRFWWQGIVGEARQERRDVVARARGPERVLAQRAVERREGPVRGDRALRVGQGVPVRGRHRVAARPERAGDLARERAARLAATTDARIADAFAGTPPLESTCGPSSKAETNREPGSRRTVTLIARPASSCIRGWVVGL